MSRPIRLVPMGVVLVGLCVGVWACGSSASQMTAEGGDGSGGTVSSPVSEETLSPSGFREGNTRPHDGPIQDIGSAVVVPVPNSDRQIPVPAFASFEEFESIQLEGADGLAVNGIRFRLPGPIEGTMVGAVSVTVGSYSAPIEDLAEVVDSTRESQRMEIAGVELIHWPNVGEIDGSNIQQGHRFGSRYAWALSPTEIVQVTTDGVDPASVEAYISELVHGIAS